MGFFGGPNKALANMGFKDQIWSQIGRKEKREGRGRIRREEEEGEIKQAKVWNFGFCMETTLGMYFVWITWNCKLYMIKCLSSNLGF